MEMKYPGVGCGVMIVKDGKVLLGKRHDDPEKADSLLRGEGTWTLPGGKLDFQENLKDCVRRETMEENGIKLGKLELFSVSNDKVPGAHFVTLGFKCTEFSGEPSVMEPDEITEWKWFSLKDLPEKIFPPSRKMIANYLSGKIYGDE